MFRYRFGPRVLCKGPGYDENSVDFSRLITFFPSIYFVFCYIDIHKMHDGKFFTYEETITAGI